jgi:fatty acid desaturase
MSNKTLGAVLGAVGGGYPVLQSYTGYRSSHILGHHRYLGDPNSDPDYVQYQKSRLCGRCLQRTSLRRYMKHLLGIGSTLSYISYMLRHRIWSKDEARWEGRVRALFLAAVVAGLAMWGKLGVFVFYWIVPLVTTQAWIGSVAELLEHYPVVEIAPRTDIEMSWNRSDGVISRYVLGEQPGEGLHLVHHLFPRVPLWRLKEVDAILKGDPEYAALDRLGNVYSAITTIYRMLPIEVPS